MHLITVFVNNQPDAQFFFLYLFIPILYMFWATNCINIDTTDSPDDEHLVARNM